MEQHPFEPDPLDRGLLDAAHGDAGEAAIFSDLEVWSALALEPLRLDGGDGLGVDVTPLPRLLENGPQIARFRPLGRCALKALLMVFWITNVRLYKNGNVFMTLPLSIIKIYLIVVLFSFLLVSNVSVVANDKLGFSALDLLIERVRTEHPISSGTGLDITLNAADVDDKQIYYFSSGYEIFTNNGNIIRLSVYGFNQILFYNKAPEYNNFPATTLLANFPILPEAQPRVIEALESTQNYNVKVALTIALRDTVLLTPKTVKFLSEQLIRTGGDLQLATLFALLPRIQDNRYALMSNFDMEPVVKALSNLSNKKISSLSALLIEAMLSRGDYLIYFGILCSDSLPLLRRTAQVPARSPTEEAARQYFRDLVLP